MRIWRHNAIFGTPTSVPAGSQGRSVGDFLIPALQNFLLDTRLRSLSCNGLARKGVKLVAKGVRTYNGCECCVVRTAAWLDRCDTGCSLLCRFRSAFPEQCLPSPNPSSSIMITVGPGLCFEAQRAPVISLFSGVGGLELGMSSWLTQWLELGQFG